MTRAGIEPAALLIKGPDTPVNRTWQAVATLIHEVDDLSIGDAIEEVGRPTGYEQSHSD